MQRASAVSKPGGHRNILCKAQHRFTSTTSMGRRNIHCETGGSPGELNVRLFAARFAQPEHSNPHVQAELVLPPALTPMQAAEYLQRDTVVKPISMGSRNIH